MSANDVRSLLLGGLDGSNPLAFLAAVGTLRTLHTAAVTKPANDWCLKWVPHCGTWAPVLYSDGVVSAEELVDLIASSLRHEAAPEFEFAQDLNVSKEDFRDEAKKAQCRVTSHDRRHADFIAAFGCELFTGSDKKSIQDTGFRTMSGAGHQHFIGTMKLLVEVTETVHLRRSIFEQWDYSDGKLGLRWDPEEDRRYALRWHSPSTDEIRTMRGANRLAIEALPLLPTAPRPQELHTTGFSFCDRAVLFTWPIWECPLSLEVVRSLLALSEIQEPEPDRTWLNAMGVVEVYRSQRITVGKYRNFTRAWPV